MGTHEMYHLTALLLMVVVLLRAKPSPRCLGPYYDAALLTAVLPFCAG
jgi:hypothetical protein